MDEAYRIRRSESDAALQATDLRDIVDLGKMRQGAEEEDADWKDQFIGNFRAYLSRHGKNKSKGTAKLWTTEEVGNQLLNFLRGAIPMEPTTPEAQAEAMNRLDSRRRTLHRARTDFKRGVEYIPTPTMDGSIQAYLRSMRQHSGGMGGKA